MVDDRKDPFPKVLLVFHCVVVILFLAVCDYSPEAAADATHVDQLYNFYLHTAFMMFIGFGYLMTFLKAHGLSAVGYTMLITCVCMEWAIILIGFWHMASTGHWTLIPVGIDMLIEGVFGAAAFLISFGAVLGKLGPAQLTLAAVIEMFWYSLNVFIGLYNLKAIDIGGSMFIHTFGAYFGLALAAAVTPPKSKDHPLNSSSRTSDTFAMIGTIFLWIYWPSFNGAFGTHISQFRVVINTVLSLVSCCVTSFIVSRWMGGKRRFSMVHIQNATIAGGVAVGTSADLFLSPGGAMLIGMIAGVISVVGYEIVQPYMLRTWRLSDTCGVHNLHGMPGIFGALAGCIAIGFATPATYGAEYSTMFAHGTSQPGIQMLALLITLLIAVVGGIITGVIVNKTTTEIVDYYDDKEHWIVEDEEVKPEAEATEAESKAKEEVEV